MKLITLVAAPSQKVTSVGSVTVGVGRTVIVNTSVVPAQVPYIGVTVMVAVTGVVPALVAAKTPMLPVPLVARPIDALLLVQLNAVAVPVKLTAVVLAPSQIV